LLGPFSLRRGFPYILEYAKYASNFSADLIGYGENCENGGGSRLLQGLSKIKCRNAAN